MSSRSQHYGFQSATMVQSANGSHAYLFGNNGSENDLSEEDGESFELRPRGRERLRRSTSRERMEDIIYLTRDIQEGDTLNSIALQYHCSVRLCLAHACVCLFLSLLAKYPLKSPSFPCWSKLFFLWHYTYTQTFLALINIIITIITMCVLLTDDLTNQWVYRIIKMTCPTLVTSVPTDVLKNTIYPSVKHCIWKTLYTICSAPNTVLHSASEVPDIFLWRW